MTRIESGGYNMTTTLSRQTFMPDYAVHPGTILKDTIEDMGITQESLATRIGMKAQSLSRILAGRTVISPDTAAKLELALGIPAKFWNSLQAQYHELVAKQEERERLELERQKRRDWIKQFPLTMMTKRGYIAKIKDETEQYRELLLFFGIANGVAWADQWDSPAVAAKCSTCFETNKWHASVWIRQGERMAEKLPCAPYDERKFKNALTEIRKLTIETPDVFFRKMVELCTGAGVALALIPEVPKVPWSGATKWMMAKPLIILNLRGKGEDRFWFSFFHEAAHVLHGSHKRLYIADKSKDPAEVEADQFAADTLIPAKYNPRIMAAKTSANITAIAKELGIAPGIVAGRYEHLTERWTHFRGLIRSLKMVENKFRAAP
jgi:addiction module HigA family antidote